MITHTRKPLLIPTALSTCATASSSTECQPTDMRTLWRGIVRSCSGPTSAGRGSTTLLSPDHPFCPFFSPLLIHFNDQPPVGPPPSQALIELRSMSAGQIATYRVDARLLASPFERPNSNTIFTKPCRKTLRTCTKAASKSSASSPSAAKATPSRTTMFRLSLNRGSQNHFPRTNGV